MSARELQAMRTHTENRPADLQDMDTGCLGNWRLPWLPRRGHPQYWDPRAIVRNYHTFRVHVVHLACHPANPHSALSGRDYVHLHAHLDLSILVLARFWLV